MTPYSAAAVGSLDSRSSSRRGLLVDLLGQVRLVDAVAQLVDLGLGLVGLAQLVLDGLELLAQDVLALGLVHLRLDLVLDLGAQLQHFQLPVHEGGEAAQPLGEVDLFEQLLLVLGLEAHGGGDEVAESRRVVDVGGRQLQLVGQVGDQLDDPGVDGDEVALQRLQFGARHHDVGQVVHHGGQVRLFGDEPLDLDAPDPLGDDAQRAVGGLDHLLDGGEHPDGVDVVRAGHLDVRPFGGHQAHLLVAAQDVVDEGDRPGLAHGQRRHGVGEDHGVLERQDGQHRRRGADVIGRVARQDDEVGAGGREGLRVVHAHAEAERAEGAVAGGHACCPPSPSSLERDRDLLAGRARPDGQDDLQEAVAVVGAGLGGVHLGRQHHHALEAAVGDLHLLVDRLGMALVVAHAADAEHAVLDLEVHLRRVHPGQVELDHDGLLLLVEVHVGVGPEGGLAVARHPLAAEQVEEHAVHLALQPRRTGPDRPCVLVPLRPRLIGCAVCRCRRSALRRLERLQDSTQFVDQLTVTRPVARLLRRERLRVQLSSPGR